MTFVYNVFGPSIMGKGGVEFCDEFLTLNLHFIGLLFARQNYSLTLSHVTLFCHCYFFIFKHDPHYLLKPVKICFFLEKIVIAYGMILGLMLLGPDTNTMKTPSQICAVSV